MYEETIARLQRIVNVHKGRLTPFMRETICEAIIAIRKLSKTSEHAYWTIDGKCSNCGEEPLTEYDVELMNFCPNCGKDMRRSRNA